MTTHRPAAPAPLTRPPLLTRPLLLRFVSLLGSAVSFYLLLSVAPIYAQGTGGGGGAAGLATGALMAATVGGELGTPWLANRYGYRVVLGAGLVLLGAPALVLTLSSGLAWIVLICLLRGFGFALTVVAGGALTAALIPDERRGEGLALVGIVAGAPALGALPLGVWAARHFGYTPVAVAAGVAALAAVASVPGLPDGERGAGRGAGVLAGLRTPALARPALVFGASALVAGIIVTFLPLAVASASAGVVAAALFLQPLASTAARVAAGRIGDRRGAAGMVPPGVVLSAAGVLLTALTGHDVAVLAGVTVFGVGFGLLQNATLVLMYARVPRSGYGTVSALWNLAYDAGMGAGALGFGLVAGRTGYPWAFVLTAALLTAALPVALRDVRGASRSPGAVPGTE
ncbi:MFS transporter [Actinomadura verrucosospora]|uniref:MFS transporter n=1 Tax=Actinomadura verrucosospora TaxID=46165 RepID=A0A7D3VYK6_ACTVE|nr:MFS transporter [Actinomadura verrucosospora]QKG26955.1 MFS transporter [Actinomadura verrucosospora]